MKATQHQQIHQALQTLKLPWMRLNYEPLLEQALKKQTGSLEYLHELLAGEAQARQERAAERRIRAARFPVMKTLDTFNWQWPKADRCLILPLHGDRENRELALMARHIEAQSSTQHGIFNVTKKGARAGARALELEGAEH
jgi:DNA replication protein DnaC